MVKVYDDVLFYNLTRCPSSDAYYYLYKLSIEYPLKNLVRT